MKLHLFFLLAVYVGIKIAVIFGFHIFLNKATNVLCYSTAAAWLHAVRKASIPFRILLRGLGMRLRYKVTIYPGSTYF